MRVSRDIVEACRLGGQRRRRAVVRKQSAGYEKVHMRLNIVSSDARRYPPQAG